MKKLLSFVIVAMMIVSMVLPVFAVAEKPTDDAGVVNTMSVYMLDTQVDVNDQNTVNLTFYLANNEDGFEYLKFYFFYPECLTMTRMAVAAKSIGGIFDRGDLTAGIENTAMTKNLADALDTLGIDAETFEFDGYKYSSPFIDAERFDEEDADEDGDYDEAVDVMTEEGAIVTVTFTYDAAANPTNQHDFEIWFVDSPDDNLHCYNEDSPYCDAEVNVNYYPGTLTLLFDPDEEHVHDYVLDEDASTPATCTEAGENVYVCQGAGECDAPTYSEVVPALGHDEGAWVRTVEPTEDAAGTEELQCTRCGAVLDTREVEPLPHEHVAGEPVVENEVAGDCQNAGSYDLVTYCAKCGEEISREPVDTGLGDHVKGARARITTAPTTSSAGVLSYRCAVCDKLQTGKWDEEIPAIEPAFALEIADATAEPGDVVEVPIMLTNTNYGTDLIRTLVYWDEDLDVTFDFEGNDVYTDPYDTATFLEVNASRAKFEMGQEDIDFATDGKTFAILMIDIPDDELGHRFASGSIGKLVITAPDAEGEYEFGFLNVDPPCSNYYTEDENDGHIWFADFIDYDMPENTAATLTVESAPVEHVHNYVLDEDASTPATCTEPGENVYVCIGEGECDEPSYSEVVPATGIHTPGEAVEENRVEPTCVDAGSYDLVTYCTVCEQVISSEPQTIPATGIHTPGEAAEENRVEPADCVTDGSYDLVVRCTVCGEIISSEPQVIEAPGHTPAAEWVVEGDYEVLYCAVCGAELDRRAIEVPPVDEPIDVELVLCSTLASGDIDNNARVINVTTKKDAAKAVFQLKLAGATFTMTDEAFAAGNKIQINKTLYSEKPNVGGIRYFISYPANGYEQTYEIEVEYEGKTYVYTVNVTFDHSPACDGVVPCMNANADLTGFDPEDASIIHAVANPGASYVTFRLNKLAKGTTVSIANYEDTPHLYQTADKGESYSEVDADSINSSALVYFRTNKSDAAREYDIVLTYSNGDSETYHVIVEFPEG